MRFRTKHVRRKVVSIEEKTPKHLFIFAVAKTSAMKIPDKRVASISTALTAVIVIVIVVVAAVGAYYVFLSGSSKTPTSSTTTTPATSSSTTTGSISSSTTGAVSSSSSNQCLQVTGANASLYQQAQSEGTVVVYGVTPANVMNAEISAFKSICSGINPEYTKYSSGAAYTKVVAEVSSGNEQFDLINENTGPMSLLVASNYVSNYTITAGSNYPSSAKSSLLPEPYFRSAPFVIEYNQQTLQTLNLQPPKSFQDLLPPPWSGKIVLVPPDLNPSTTYLFASLNQTLFNGNSSATENFLKALGAQKPLSVADYSTAASDLVSGQAAVSITYAQYVAIDASCHCLNYSIPNPLAAQPELVALGKSPPHLAAAQLFLDYLYSAPAQRLIANQGIQVYYQGILPNITGWQSSYIPISTPILSNSTLSSLTSQYASWLGI